jgi:hypothetical protein
LTERLQGLPGFPLSEHGVDGGEIAATGRLYGQHAQKDEHR